MSNQRQPPTSKTKKVKTKCRKGFSKHLQTLNKQFNETHNWISAQFEELDKELNKQKELLDVLHENNQQMLQKCVVELENLNTNSTGEMNPVPTPPPPNPKNMMSIVLNEIFTLAKNVNTKIMTELDHLTKLYSGKSDNWQETQQLIWEHESLLEWLQKVSSTQRISISLNEKDKTLSFHLPQRLQPQQAILRTSPPQIHQSHVATPPRSSQNNSTPADATEIRQRHVLNQDNINPSGKTKILLSKQRITIARGNQGM